MTKPNYYAVIPAPILFNEKLSNNAKIMFGVIATLTNLNKECYATDDYFSRILNTSKPSVQRWLKELEENNIIDRRLIYKEGTKSIEKRYIYIQEYAQSKTIEVSNQKQFTPPIKNDRDNTSLTDSNNNLTDSKYIFEGDTIKLTAKDYDALKNMYSNIDLDFHLKKVDLEFMHDKPKKWFVVLSAKLNYHNTQAKSKVEQQQNNYNRF